MNTTELLDDILRREGSEHTNHPNDRGKSTKFGITQRAWSEYRTRHAMFSTPQEVKFITEAEARRFYLMVHIEPLEWMLHDELRALYIDIAINHGPSRAAKWLQAAANVKVDGRIGPITKRAVNAKSDGKLYAELLKTRFRFYAQIATDQRTDTRPDPDSIFLRGWISRACEFIV